MDPFTNLNQLILPEYTWTLREAYEFIALAAIGFILRGIFRRNEATAEDATTPHGPAPSLSVWPQHHTLILAWWTILMLIAALGIFLSEQLLVTRILLVATTGWIIISMASAIVRDTPSARLVAFLGYLGILFYLFYWVDSASQPMSIFSVQIGAVSLGADTFLKGTLIIVITWWVSIHVSDLAENRIGAAKQLTPSLRVLLQKLVKVAIFAFAFLIVLNAMGIDLTVLTIFSGGIGLGIGIGLQKVVSNLVSGFILLADRSIKPNDVIEIDGTYGWINNLRARYVSIITRDGTEHLVPNEDLITQHVINWSHTHNLVRLKSPIGVSYNADVQLARKLVIQAASENVRSLSDPPPVCLLKGFGDSSVDLELRFWINDPAKGISNVRSDILLRVWDLFHEHDIEIPFPQRDLHLRSPEKLQVEVVAPDRPDPD